MTWSLNSLYCLSFPSGNSGRVETPSRTLINPVLARDGQVSSSNTVPNSQAASSAALGEVVASVPVEVVIDVNGHAQTVMAGKVQD